VAQPLTFNATTETFALPLLFAGQAQKEFYINQALLLIDTLLQGCVDDSLTTPPASASDGETYRIETGATGHWQGRDGTIAISVGQSWHYVAPKDGMRIYDRTANQLLFFQSIWHMASVPAEPQGGTTIDAEARATLAQVVEAMRDVGILPA